MKIVWLEVNVSSVKMNILLDGTITLEVNLNFLSCKEISDFLLSRT